MSDNCKQPYFDFDEYIRQGEPETADSAKLWQTAIGLQAVDGLKPSQYLIDTARRNIEGEITMDEVQRLLRSYYANAENRDKADKDDEEADKASANIKRILSTSTLAFNTNGFIATHRRIFDGVMKHAGELRKYDITKKEWVLATRSITISLHDTHGTSAMHWSEQITKILHLALTMTTNILNSSSATFCLTNIMSCGTDTSSSMRRTIGIHHQQEFSQHIQKR